MGMMRDNVEGCDVSTANGDSGGMPLRKIIKLPAGPRWFFATRASEKPFYRF